MARRPLFFCLLLFVLLAAAISPVSAVEEITQEHIKSFSLDAPEDLTFSGIDLLNIDANSNTTIYLYQSSGLTTLNINTSKTYGSYWTFELSLTSPNGTIQTQKLNKVAILNNNYDLHIQYFYTLWNETLIDESYDIDIYTSLIPFSTSFETWQPVGYEVEDFYRVKAESTSYFDLIIYAVTAEELEAQRENDILAAYKESLSDFFSWTWDAVLSFVELIPYVGDDLVTAILIASYIIDEIFFYFNLFLIEYIETTILSLEFFVLTYSIVRTKSKNPVKLIKNVVSDQIAVLDFIIEKARFAIELLIRIINAIAQIVQSLKPI